MIRMTHVAKIKRGIIKRRWYDNTSFSYPLLKSTSNATGSKFSKYSCFVFLLICVSLFLYFSYSLKVLGSLLFKYLAYSLFLHFINARMSGEIQGFLAILYCLRLWIIFGKCWFSRSLLCNIPGESKSLKKGSMLSCVIR